MNDEAWIQQSLARLEALEAQREQLEATGQAAKLAEVDSEIRALYEALESIADDDEAADEEAETRVQVQAAEVASAAAPAMAASAPGQPAPAGFGGSPFDAPAPAAPAPMGVSYDAGFDGSMGGYDDDIDVSPPKSKAPMVLLGLVVVGALGGGGWFYMQNQPKAEPAAPAAPAEPQVIMSAEVPEDTQEPDAAKGVDADRTPGTEVKSSGRSRSPSRSSNRSRSRSRSDRSRPKKDDGRKIEVGGDSRDPLAGLD